MQDAKVIARQRANSRAPAPGCTENIWWGEGRKLPELGRIGLVTRHLYHRICNRRELSTSY